MPNKVERVMGEFKRGELHSGSPKGPVVKDRKQAIAIGLAEQRRAGMADGGMVEGSPAEEAMDRRMGVAEGAPADMMQDKRVRPVNFNKHNRHGAGRKAR